MRITSMVLSSSNLSEPISFSLSQSEPQNEYIIRSIVGLDAEEIVPKFQGFSLSSKSRFYSFNLPPRDIAFRVVLNPLFVLDQSYSDVRDRLYKAISATRTGVVNLQFFSGATTVAQLYGSIIKFESTYFDKTPEVQITIRCSDPLFRAINRVNYLDNNPLPVSPFHIYDSLSTAPHGFNFTAKFTNAVSTFTIQDRNPNPEWKFEVTPTTDFAVDDTLHFSSEVGNRYIYVIRVGDPAHHHLIDKITPGSIWPILFPGDNSFYITHLDDFDWLDLSFYPAYWGV